MKTFNSFNELLSAQGQSQTTNVWTTNKLEYRGFDDRQEFVDSLVSIWGCSDATAQAAVETLEKDNSFNLTLDIYWDEDEDGTAPDNVFNFQQVMESTGLQYADAAAVQKIAEKDGLTVDEWVDLLKGSAYTSNVVLLPDGGVIACAPYGSILSR